ncbi:MAG: dihydroorotate dehydrogenase [Victivallales bacterium]|jgi:dihydroorotate dehydrogenase (NAD+) catalytic subunit|nr:dihydroorotate dehydrogenase [Victivallales bacterium]
MADLTCNLGKITLKNPVMTASGTFGYGYEYNQYYDISQLGAVVVKGICLAPSPGNPTPRVAEVSGGMLNAIGLQGPGVDAFLHGEHYLPFLRSVNATVFVNIWGKTVEEYGEVAARLDAESSGIAALEINISCPNVKAGGVAFGTNLKLAHEVVSLVRSRTNLPIITKLSPNVTCIADFARAVVDAGSDMVSLINTIPGLSIDIETRKCRIANRTGGLSGPALKPIAVRMVNEVARAVSIPIIGMGGIMTGEDAIEFFLAGASAIAVGTANFVDPYAAPKVIASIDAYLDRHRIRSIAEIVGKLEQ